MGLEVANYLPELVPSNPAGSDPVSAGDDHIRNVKLSLKNTFPAFVGSTAVPKSVSLTEDQINALVDATLAAANEIITGVWEFPGLRLGNSLAVAGWDLGRTTTYDLVHVAASDVVVVGNSAVQTIIRGSTTIDYEIAAEGSVARGVSSAEGSLTVKDLAGTFKKVGFRNPTNQGDITSDVTPSLSSEGQLRSITGAGGFAITLGPGFAAGDTVTFYNVTTLSSPDCTFIPGAGVTLIILDPDLYDLTGLVSFKRGGIVTTWWHDATLCYLYGTGLSRV